MMTLEDAKTRALDALASGNRGRAIATITTALSARDVPYESSGEILARLNGTRIWKLGKRAGDDAVREWIESIGEVHTAR